MSSIRRKLALGIVLSLAVAGLSAAPASAYPQPGDVTVTNPATGQPCPTPQMAAGTIVGGCEVWMTNLSTKQMQIYGTNCKLDFKLHFGDDGWAWASNVTTPSCVGLVPSFAWAGGELLFEELDAWLGYVRPNGAGGWQLVLYANFDARNSIFSPSGDDMREYLELNISSNANGMYLVNSIQKMVPNETDNPTRLNMRWFYKGEWQGNKNVTITAN